MGEYVGSGLFMEEIIALMLQPGEQAFHVNPFTLQRREMFTKTSNLCVEYLQPR